MAYTAGLLLALAAFWFAMSGVFSPLHIGLGAASVIAAMIAAYRLDILDREGAPYLRILGFARFMPWLVVQVLKANWTVVRACLKADLDIEPALVKVRTECKSDIGRVTFANAITLTPGTVTVDVDGDKLLIHALYENAALPESFADMDRRSARAAGEKA
jgi:multicomponent Na+:H+ antiporter subunit E